jgi:diaminohydroxyphosphoribosylaminopyrimidine deaminase/5-amino-6-(5-phosphoribosylamino)uracil reductase
VPLQCFSAYFEILLNGHFAKITKEAIDDMLCNAIFADLSKMSDHHSIYMRRCIQLAKLGHGFTAPNPMVGAVIVNEGEIIGEGWHKKFGGPHAEVEAILSVAKKEFLPYSTIYVNLEPCNHQGKTPPCTELIISSGIKKVVVGMTDPNPIVSGKGIEHLRTSGIEVILSVEEEAAKELNRAFIVFHEQKRPYILLKWAQSLDGFIGRPNEKVWISNRIAGMESHRLRSIVQAILIAENTARLDDPQLTNRDWFGHSPIRIILDRRGDLPDALNVFNGKNRTIVFTYNADKKYLNAEKIVMTIGTPVVREICDVMVRLQIHSLLVEGGSSILNEFIDANVWDEARIYVAESTIEHGVKAPVIPMVPFSIESLGNNQRISYINQQWL